MPADSPNVGEMRVLTPVSGPFFEFEPSFVGRGDDLVQLDLVDEESATISQDALQWTECRKAIGSHHETVASSPMAQEVGQLFGNRLQCTHPLPWNILSKAESDLCVRQVSLPHSDEGRPGRHTAAQILLRREQDRPRQKTQE